MMDKEVNRSFVKKVRVSSIYGYMHKPLEDEDLVVKGLNGIREELQKEIYSLNEVKNKYEDFMKLLFEDDDILIDAINIVQKSHPGEKISSGKQVAYLITAEEIIELLKEQRLKTESLAMALIIHSLVEENNKSSKKKLGLKKKSSSEKSAKNVSSVKYYDKYFEPFDED